MNIDEKITSLLQKGKDGFRESATLSACRIFVKDLETVQQDEYLTCLDDELKTLLLQTLETLGYSLTTYKFGAETLYDDWWDGCEDYKDIYDLIVKSDLVQARQLYSELTELKKKECVFILGEDSNTVAYLLDTMGNKFKQGQPDND